VRRFLNRHPAGTVVSLGEGLEGQFWRLDNGRMHWLSIDLPAVLDLRHRVLPEGPRQRSHAGSALDLGWLDELDPAQPVLVTAQGLLPYFRRNEVHELIAAIAERLPGSSFVFDVVPEKMLELVRRQPGRERDQAVPPRAPGLVPLILWAIRHLPQRVRYALPVLPVLQVSFG
jgi:O-methyltransferase involved in polyketide biosynthesis